MSPRTRRKFYLSPFPSNGHKQKPTIAPLSIYARNTLCLLQLSIFFHPFYPTLLFQTTIVDRYKLQIRSDRTVQFLDFQQTDFNDFTGVGISTSCFCLNYHNFLLPFHAQVIVSNNVSTTSHRSFFYLTPTVLLSFHERLTSCYRISTIRTVLTPALVASASTTTTFPTYVSFLSISKAPKTTKSHCS